jgi:YfiH family protein
LAPGVRVVVTTRRGGHSASPRAGLNLATHVGDVPACVVANRQCLQQVLQLPAAPWWLQQVHGIQVFEPAAIVPDAGWPLPVADAACTRHGAVLAVLTADCLPVVLAAADGSAVAVAHAGWRGLAAGVLEASLAALRCAPDAVTAWLGPAIGPRAFEVGDEVREVFVSGHEQAAMAFVANARGRWQADLGLLAMQRLEAAGVTRVGGGGVCTVSDPTRWYSYRRDSVPGADTGRFVTLVWRERVTL